MARLTMLGAVLAALLVCAGTAGAVEEEVLLLRGGDGDGSVRINSFQRTPLNPDLWPGNDAKTGDSPKPAPFPVFLKWKNACRRQSAADPSGWAGDDDFREVAPYSGPADAPAETGWLEALLAAEPSPGERRDSGRWPGEFGAVPGRTPFFRTAGR